jgi:sRNA-binding protein
MKQSTCKNDRELNDKTESMFDKGLDLTEQWLEETFPHLFAADDYLPLDHLLLQDLKDDNDHFKYLHPEYWAIKSAVFRYKNSYGYLWCLREGASRYNLKGEVCGIVTKEEEKAAKKILETL